MATEPPREGGGPNPPFGEDFFQRIVNVHWGTGATGPGPPVITTPYIWFRVAPDGDWNGNPAANPATGVGGIDLSVIAGVFFPIFTSMANFNSATINFGADTTLIPFVGEIPNGFTTKPAATWNPADKNANITLSDNNLTATSGGGILGGLFAGVRATMSFSPGEKWYWEVKMTLWESGTRVGAALPTAGLGSIFTLDTVALFVSGGVLLNLFTVSGVNLGPRASGDVIGFALREVTVPASA